MLFSFKYLIKAEKNTEILNKQIKISHWIYLIYEELCTTCDCLMNFFAQLLLYLNCKQVLFSSHFFLKSFIDLHPSTLTFNYWFFCLQITLFPLLFMSLNQHLNIKIKGVKNSYLYILQIKNYVFLVVFTLQCQFFTPHNNLDVDIGITYK